jgi:hypothetical protein
MPATHQASIGIRSRYFQCEHQHIHCKHGYLTISVRVSLTRCLGTTYCIRSNTHSSAATSHQHLTHAVADARYPSSKHWPKEPNFECERHPDTHCKFGCLMVSVRLQGFVRVQTVGSGRIHTAAQPPAFDGKLLLSLSTVSIWTVHAVDHVENQHNERPR